jgi:DNA primase
VYKCWSCFETHGTSGSLYSLVKRYGTKEQLQQLLLIMPEDYTPPEKKYQKPELPHQFISLLDVPPSFKPTHIFRQLENYLKSRGITETHIRKHGLGFCYEGPYAGRIIIPSYDASGKLNYFTGRSYCGQRQKYQNPEADKKTLIFNESLIDWTRDIYLVEGPIDSLFVENSIALLGKFMGDMLWERLYRDATANIYILLDGDAWSDAERLYWRLNGGKLHGRVKVVKLPEDKDIADLRGVINDEWIMELERA